MSADLAEDLVHLLVDDQRAPTGAARRTLCVRLLRQIAVHRPLVLHIDQPQWGRETMAVMRKLAEGPPVAVMMLVTTSAHLQGVPEHRHLTVAPLDRPHTQRLIDALLHVEAPLAESLAERAEGVPLFVAQLLGDWVSRGVLVPGPDGWRLAKGAQVAIPDALHGVWVDRVADAAGVGRGTEALEIAAVLGVEVDWAEWRAAAESAGVAIPAGLLDGLVDGGLAAADGDRWRFAHGLLAESLVRQAEEGGRVAAHHAACAQALAQAQHHQAHKLHRRAHHLEMAGAVDLALDAACEAVTAYFTKGSYSASLELAETGCGLLDRDRFPPSDPRRGLLRMFIGRVAERRGDFDAATERFEVLLRNARTHGWLDLRAAALHQLGHMAGIRGHGLLAEHLLRSGLAFARREGLMFRELDIVRGLAGHLGYEGRNLESLGLLDQALPSAEASGAGFQHGSVLLARGSALLSLNRLDEADTALLQAQAILVAEGAHHQVSRIANLRGEVARLRGDLDSALSHYRASLSFRERSGDAISAPHRLNVALTFLALGEPAAAAEYAAEALDETERLGFPTFMGHAAVVLMHASAQLGDWDRCESLAERVAPSLRATRSHEADTARSLHAVGSLAAEAGRASLAVRALGWAVVQWRPLVGFEQEEASAKAALAALL
jgi:eukaryotic-like serine/threonine-protein kinase